LWLRRRQRRSAIRSKSAVGATSISPDVIWLHLDGCAAGIALTKVIVAVKGAASDRWVCTAELRIAERTRHASKRHARAHGGTSALAVLLECRAKRCWWTGWRWGGWLRRPTLARASPDGMSPRPNGAIAARTHAVGSGERVRKHAWKRSLVDRNQFCVAPIATSL
jgi:hypothetical protein